jgi:hypothetical protein
MKTWFKENWPVVIVILAVGIGIGWLLKPNAVSAPAGTGAPDAKTTDQNSPPSAPPTGNPSKSDASQPSRESVRDAGKVAKRAYGNGQAGADMMARKFLELLADDRLNPDDVCEAPFRNGNKATLGDKNAVRGFLRALRQPNKYKATQVRMVQSASPDTSFVEAKSLLGGLPGKAEGKAGAEAMHTFGSERAAWLVRVTYDSLSGAKNNDGMILLVKNADIPAEARVIGFLD